MNIALVCLSLKLKHVVLFLRLFANLLLFRPVNFLFHDQEKSIANLGTDHQEARKEIISLKEQLASTSQVRLTLVLQIIFQVGWRGAVGSSNTPTCFVLWCERGVFTP